MNAIIISIGNELLSGYDNTNASWLSQKLNETGISVIKILTVPDSKNDIFDAIDASLIQSDIILMTGGLGPTKDDITKGVLCKYFNCGLKICESSYKNVEKIFKDRGLSVSSLNKKQAEVPELANTIPNLSGTAPGLWFDIEERTLVAMPGVPFEMKLMFESFVIPKLKDKYTLPYIISKTILIQGIGESALSELIAPWEKSIPHDIKLAYLPSPGIVKLRLTALDIQKDFLENTINNLTSQLQQLIPEYIYGYDNQNLEDIIASLLIKKNASVSIAESCTGGYLSHLITSCPGSSEYFKGSVIAYSNQIKTNILKIKSSIIDIHGAVSEETVREMAVKVKKLFNTTYSIAVTGIAGPSGGTPQKPVGTVWIAVASPEAIISKIFLFGENRNLNIKKSSITALNLLRKLLIIN